MAVVCSVLVVGSGRAPVFAEEADLGWRPSIRSAASYAAARQGNVRFAFIDDRGRFYGHDSADRVPAASVFKVMLLAAYLRMPEVRDRDLREADRGLLAPMICWSDNAAATRIRNLVGAKRIYGLASKAGMQDFALHSTWGLSRTSARDQVRFIPPRSVHPEAPSALRATSARHDRSLAAVGNPQRDSEWLEGVLQGWVGLWEGPCGPPGRLPRVGRAAHRDGDPDNVEPEP